MPWVTVIIERYGHDSPGAAVKVGRRSSAALNFTTGDRICHASSRARNASGTASGPSMPSARFGSAFDTTTFARIRSPPSRRTPSPGRISATGTPAASTAPRSRAASAMAKLIRPMPPST